MKLEDIPRGKPFRLTGKDLTVFEISKNTGVINIWFRDLQQFISMPNYLRTSWLKKIKNCNYVLVDKLPKFN